MAILTTQRLRLEPLRPAHAPDWYRGLSDPDLYHFLDERPPTDLPALAARIARWAAGPETGGERWCNWAVWRAAGDRPVGWVQATVHEDATAHVAYVLFRDAWGHGYAREAVRAVIEHLGATFGTRCILARVDARNARSIGVLEALGFSRLRALPGSTADATDLEYVRAARPVPLPSGDATLPCGARVRGGVRRR